MLENEMNKTIAKWRRDAEKRRKRIFETPEEARKRAEQEIERMVRRSKRPPKTDEDVNREYEREIEKLTQRSIQNHQSTDAK